MSDIVDRLRNPKRALWYCREFSRGDDESLDIQEAADEIERLRGLLQRHHELRGKPAREEWVDGGPTYRLAMQLWRDTAAALAGAAVQPIAVTGNCGLCGQPRADHAEVAPDGKPECRMKENSHHG